MKPETHAKMLERAIIIIKSVNKKLDVLYDKHTEAVGYKKAA